MNKPIKIVLAILTALVIFGAYQYFVNFAPTKKPEVSALKDAVTGAPILQEEVTRIENQQKIDKRTFFISGPVVSNKRGVLVVTRKEGGNIYLKLSSNGVVVKKDNGKDFSIKIDDIKVGDTVSVVFPGGITEEDIAASGELSVRNITVYSPSTESEK
jgi:hypothetical protein